MQPFIGTYCVSTICNSKYVIQAVKNITITYILIKVAIDNIPALKIKNNDAYVIIMSSAHKYTNNFRKT